MLPAPETAHTGRPLPGCSERPVRVLVVDDEDGVREFFRVVLHQAGYDVQVARDGAEAVGRLRSWTPDVVLMDLVMPNREGLETILVLREDHPELPIIAVSGAWQGDVYLKLASAFGAGLTLSKPVTPQQLLDAVAATRS